MADNDHKGPKWIGEILPPVKPLSRVHKRLLTMPLFEEGEDANIVYQHSVFCQTCMPSEPRREHPFLGTPQRHRPA